MIQLNFESRLDFFGKKQQFFNLWEDFIECDLEIMDC